MEFEHHPSGLVVPKPKPEQPQRRYGPLEIQNEERRAAAREALLGLWDAIDLSRPPGGIRFLDDSTPVQYEMHDKLYRLLAEVLLGPDYPQRDVLT